MLQIAICEDNENELRMLQALLAEELPLFFADARVAAYSSGQQLIEAAASQEIVPDLLFLDIFLEDTTGIQVAEALREMDSARRAQIIFITSSREYIMESYHIQAAYYIVKPVTRKWLHLALERAASLLEADTPMLCVKIDRSMVRIPQSSIQYVETFGNKTYIHTDQDTLCVYKPLREIRQLLREEDFLQIQRGILAHMAFIQSIQNNVCTLRNGQSYPLSRKNSAALREQYFDYLFRNHS